MSYPDFPPGQSDPYRDRPPGRSRDRRGTREDGYGNSRDASGYRGRGDGGEGYGRSRGHDRGEEPRGRRGRDGQWRGYGSRDGGPSRGNGYGGDNGYGGRADRGRGDRARGEGRSGWGASRLAGAARGAARGGSRSGGGDGYGRDGYGRDAYSRDGYGPDGYGHGGGRGRRGAAGGSRGRLGSALAGVRERAGLGSGDRRGGEDRLDGGGEHADFWTEEPPMPAGGHRRSRDGRDGDGYGPDGRDTWARRGATALRDRYRDATDWFTAQQQEPGGVARFLPFLAKRAEGRRGGGGYDGWDGRGPRPRRKGDWWRRWTWKKVLAVLGAAFVMVALAGTAAVAYEYNSVQIPPLSSGAAAQASRVYFSDGKTFIGRFGNVDRASLNTYSQIPQVAIDAFVAAEDKNFFTEGGISPTGIVRAAYEDVTNPNGGLQGGSTITQELVRNYYQNVGFAQTFNRKIYEIFIAEKLAHEKSKQWVMLTYLNTINFGNNVYGLATAANYYFGLPLNQLNKLTASQAALLTALPNDPNYLGPALENPKQYPAAYTALRNRWQYVLQVMAKDGYLSAQAAAQAKFPTIAPPVNNSWNSYRGYIMDAVNAELQNTYHLSSNEIQYGGLKIVTTFNKNLQTALMATVKHARTLMRHNNPPTPPGPAYLGMTPTGLPGYVNIGAVLEDPHTGAIQAMYPGKGYNAKRQYNMALTARNQVGSSFKPYVLATAVSEGMNVFTSQLNGYSPLWIPPDSQPTTLASVKQPANSGSYFKVVNDEVSNPNHPVRVLVATAMSLNTAYTDLWHRVAIVNGQHAVVNMAKAFGVNVAPYSQGGSDLGDPNMWDKAGTALGQASLTVEEQATMMATLANGGTYHAPHLVKEIQYPSGAVTKAHPAQHQVLDTAQVSQVDYAMSEDFNPAMGTAGGLGMTNGQPAIAKTGTTNYAQQAFFLGATPYEAMAIGMFTDQGACPKDDTAYCNSTLALKYGAPPKDMQTLFGVGAEAGYGGQWPAIIWSEFFNKEFNGHAIENFPAPDQNYGTAWNLAAKVPKPKPKPKPTGPPNCFGNGKHCRQPGPSPTSSTPQPCIGPFCGPSPTASSTATSTLPPTAGPKAAGQTSASTTSVAGTAVAGTVLFGGVAAVALPARRRRRPRPRS